VRFTAAAAAVVLAVACGRAPSPQVSFVGSPGPTAVEVRGLPSRDLTLLSTLTLTTEQWHHILRIEMSGSGGVALAGSYAAEGGIIRFTPMYGFEAGHTFVATFDPTRIPGINVSEPWRHRIEQSITLPAAVLTRSTSVTQVYPSGSVLPENMLRFYIEFSAPMGRGSPLEHIRLMQDGGKEVVDPFLPVEAEFWNSERTRFTLFFDPGRVKRGIKPNRDMGRALIAGKRYTLVISDQWLDGRGQPLKGDHRHTFTAGPAVEKALDTSEWKIDAPVGGTRDPLVVTFPRALDEGLLLRALSIQKRDPGLAARGSGFGVPGEVRIESAETRWVLTPRDPWTSGKYALVLLTILEDPAGNRIGRAFEVRRAVDEGQDRVEIGFTVK
jgi:hypothetical protein